MISEDLVRKWVVGDKSVRLYYVAVYEGQTSMCVTVSADSQKTEQHENCMRMGGDQCPTRVTVCVLYRTV